MRIILVLMLIVHLGYTTEVLRPPSIVEQPTDVVVRRNEPTTLNCKTDGFPAPTVEWFKDGQRVRSTANRMILPSGGLFFLHVLQVGKVLKAI